MTTIVTRAGKGTPLTNTEVDTNFTNLNTDKLELGGTFSSGTANSVLYLNASKVLTTGSALTFDGTNFATTGSGTVKNLLLTAGTLPGAGNPSISLRSSDNVVYYQSGSANTIVMLDSAQNTMQSIGATAQIWNISNAEQMRLTSTGLILRQSGAPANTSVSLNTTIQNALTLEADGDLLVGTTTNTNSSKLVASGTISETVSSTQYLVASQFDIGTAANEIPLNQYLGNLAYQDAGSIAGPVGLGGAVTLYAGTANGVPYLNASKVLTTGSALTFDGTNLAVGASATSSAALVYLNKSAGSSDNGATGSTLFLNAGSETTTANLIRFNGAIAQALFYGRAVNADAHVWGGSSSGEFMRLNPTGLGLGTNNPAYKLDVNGNVNIGSTSSADTALFVKSSTVTGLVGAQSNYSAWSSGGLTTAMNIGTTTNNGISFGTNNIGRLNLDSSGNLGLGVTPSAWSGYTALQVGSGFTAWSSGVANARINANTYYNGGYKYVGTGTATMYEQDGYHAWYNAPSGTANSAVVAASKSYTVVALGTTTLAQWQAFFNDSSNNPLTVTPTLGQVLTGNATGTLVGGGLVTQNISFTQAMTLDASGNLGVGTTSPNFFGSGSKGITVNGSSGSHLEMLSNGASLGFLLANSNGLQLQTNSNNPLIFNTNNTERARITSGGYFKAASLNASYINSSGSYHEFNVNVADDTVRIRNESTSTPYGIDINFSGAAPDNNTQYFLQARDNASGGTTRCIIYSDGDLANHDGVYGTISDQKLKQDIVDAGSQWDDIKAIRFRKYRMKSDVAVNPDAPALLGVVAQELEQVSPGLVDEHPDMETVEVTDEDGNVTQTQQPTGTTTKTVKSSILLMKAAVALQEAMARIEKLEAEVAALKGA